MDMERELGYYWVEWKKDNNTKFSLRTGVGVLYLTWNQVIGGKDSIVLDIHGNQNLELTIASVKIDKTEEKSSLVRLFNAVTIYHQNYLNEHLDKIMKELQKMGDVPF